MMSGGIGCKTCCCCNSPEGMIYASFLTCLQACYKKRSYLAYGVAAAMIRKILQSLYCICTSASLPCKNQKIHSWIGSDTAIWKLSMNLGIKPLMS